VLLLIGCTVTLDSRTAVQAEANHAAHRTPGCQVLSEPAVKVIKPFAAGIVALYTYDCAERDTGLRFTLSGIVALQRDGLGWSAAGGGASGLGPTGAVPPVEVSTGGGDRESAQWTYVGGLVHDPAVRTVAVTFQDRTHEIVPVENGAYLAARSSGQPLHTVDALDAQARILYTVSRVAPAH
jgi:hypothetical protein